MIIRFAVENWRSFRNRAELDMTATRERQHSDRLSVSPALGVKLLPVTAIFGANASGKTKFVEALSFAQRYIVEGVPSNAQIAVRPFKLDVEMEKKPSTFEFDLLINDLIYSFKFILSSSCVVEEILTVQNSYAAYELYSRKANEPMTFGSRLLKDVDEGILRVLEGGTRENMLFLTNAIGQKVKSPLLNALYSWFEKKLTVITPHSRYIQIQRLADQSDVMTDGILRLLKALDTGIDHLEEVVDHDFERKILAEQLQSIQNDLAQQRGVIRCNENSVLMREGCKTVLKKISPIHKRNDDSMVAFELSDESDGTQRLLDLVPLFYDLRQSQSSSVYVIDELDRSLHVNITRWLLTDFLNHCSAESRTQLIFTTHDVNLVDQKVFRRDELWITDRQPDGSSELYSFGEFKEVRNDKDIRKSYLSGAMGGVPNILG